MSRQEFKFKLVFDNEPMSNDLFYHWLNVRYNSCKINVINREHPDWYCYLMDIGFNVDIHIVSEENIKSLEHIAEHWFNCTPYFDPKSKAELFYHDFSKGVEHDFISTEFATPELIQMVIDAGWVYDVTPKTTYFKITNGYLFAKYQYIIGSRRICKVKD